MLPFSPRARTLLLIAITSLSTNLTLSELSIGVLSQESAKYNSQDFPALRDGESIGVWTIIEFVSPGKTLIIDGKSPYFSVQYEFQVKRTFGNHDIREGKTGSIILDIKRNDPNKQLWFELHPPNRTRLSSTPETGDQAIIFLVVTVNPLSEKRVSSDPFVQADNSKNENDPSPQTTSKKEAKTLRFSYRVVSVREDRRYDKLEALCTAIDELENSDVSISRSSALSLLHDPPQSTDSEDTFVEVLLSRLVNGVYERDHTAAVHVAGSHRFRMDDRIIAMQFLVKHLTFDSKNADFEELFARLCDEFAAANRKSPSGSRHPGQILHALYAAAARGKCPTDIPGKLFEREFDESLRTSAYRRQIAGAISPDSTRSDFPNRLKDCLARIESESDEGVREELVLAIEHSQNLSNSSRSQIEKALPDLPRPAADRLREWLAKQKPESKP